jgi:hypothetical protein
LKSNIFRFLVDNEFIRKSNQMLINKQKSGENR